MIRARYRAGWAALVASAAGVFAIVTFAAPALADIGVSPTEAPQGDSARLTLRIPNEHAPAYTTKVELDLPAATPVAEVYPMSVPNWAPGLTTRKLDRPTSLIHGTQTTEVVAAVTWQWVADPGTDPGEFQELSVSLGPLPQTDRLVLSVVQTYSDGTVVRWGGDDPTAGPAPTLTLVPATDGGTAAGGTGAAGHGAVGAGSGVDDSAAHSADDSAAHSAVPESSGLGTGIGLIASIAMVIALVAAGALLVYPRRRTPVEAEVSDPDLAADAGTVDDPDRDADPEPDRDDGHGDGHDDRVGAQGVRSAHR